MSDILKGLSPGIARRFKSEATELVVAEKARQLVASHVEEELGRVFAKLDRQCEERGNALKSCNNTVSFLLGINTTRVKNVLAVSASVQEYDRAHSDRRRPTIGSFEGRYDVKAQRFVELRYMSTNFSTTVVPRSNAKP